ncbi:hypothetical protein ANCCAN_10401 [Ancylostoma caninum]|uniref:Uncharacterized protein n=1 Tax=Ancylostoma caninum TaxID=29170 RepID=A0A368GKP5_ANCCA|nr:hypothetical protein ANCCAN_10401 [Ancylostoma caninum]
MDELTVSEDVQQMFGCNYNISGNYCIHNLQFIHSNLPNLPIVKTVMIKLIRGLEGQIAQNTNASVIIRDITGG